MATILPNYHKTSYGLKCIFMWEIKNVWDRQLATQLTFSTSVFRKILLLHWDWLFAVKDARAVLWLGNLTAFHYQQPITAQGRDFSNMGYRWKIKRSQLASLRYLSKLFTYIIYCTVYHFSYTTLGFIATTGREERSIQSFIFDIK